MSKLNLGVESHPFRLSELVSALLKTDCCHALIMAIVSYEGKIEGTEEHPVSYEGKMEARSLASSQL
jgi:hypothetical protein